MNGKETFFVVHNLEKKKDLERGGSVAIKLLCDFREDIQYALFMGILEALQSPAVRYRYSDNMRNFMKTVYQQTAWVF